MENPNLDKLVMLLSSDWFYSYWHLLGINVSDAKRSAVQKGCREIVKQFMSGTQHYWEIDFSRGRVRETEDLFRNLAKTSGMDETMFEAITACDEGNFDQGTMWLIVRMTEQLLENKTASEIVIDVRNSLEPAVGTVIKETLEQERRKWRQIEEEEGKIEAVSLSSKSPWDQYLRALTPDLPTMLPDYLSSTISQSKFVALWGLIKTVLTANERIELLNWYRARAQSLTGESLELEDV